jgi:hypothetical protein
MLGNLTVERDAKDRAKSCVGIQHVDATKSGSERVSTYCTRGSAQTADAI